MSKLTLKSESQIVGSMARTIFARTGLNDLTPGSILLTLLQAAAQEDFAQYYQMVQILRNMNLETTTGSDLENRAFEFGLERAQALTATGRVDILREESFVKISSTFYTGFRSRIAGDTELFLNDASAFPTSGAQQTLVIGRGTPNEEEVTYTPSVVNPQDNTNYFKVVLDIPLSNDHSQEETVILKQGVDTFIAAGTVVIVPASGRTPQVSFSTTVDATILAGDDKVTDVNVECSQPGTVGNISVNAITGTTAFSNPPFVGARAINDSAFSNGQDKETDTALRSRIKAHIQGLTQSTKAGISSAITGLVDSTTAKRVVSSNIILPDNVGLPVKVYIDDGTGFEPDFEEKGQEVIVASAKGGELRLQLDLFPLVKAQIETLNAEPFDMSTNSLTLNINVGDTSESITFFTNEFAIPEAATAEEVVKAINNSALLIEARTSQVGKKIVINAKADTNEQIQVTGGTANTAQRLNFSLDKVETFYLYKNDRLLSKDGTTAFIDSGNLEPFDFTGADRDLSITIDGKTANVQTATISQSDFPSLAAAASATASQVAAIINTQVAGATASSVNGRLRIISNTELSDSSKIKINTSDANTVLGFSTTEVVGRNQDYKLNAELGVIELTDPLVLYDLITAGTANTRAFITAQIPQSYTFVGGETLDIVIDGGSTQTITFSAAVNQSAQAVADLINEDLVGGLAVVRTVGPDIYLEIRTNSFDESFGSVEILSSSTGNGLFDFPEDSIVVSIIPHTAYQIAANSGPYAFVEGNTLVVVLDDDNTGKTFIITMDYDSIVSSGSSPSSFAASSLTSIFPASDELVDFWVVAKSGLNTITGDIEKVENPVVNTFRYFFKSPPPTNFEDFGVDDQASFSGMNEAGNNGNYLITDVTVIASVHAPVITRSLSTPISLTPSLGDRYLIGVDAGTSLSPSVISKATANPSALTPSGGDSYIVAPGANDTALANVKGQYTDSTNPGVMQIHGYRYIVNGSGVNDWLGHDQEIAQYNGIGVPGWIFITPSDTDVVYDEAAGTWYQFNSGLAMWEQNDWGSKAGKIATWSGSAWVFTTPLDKQVRLVTDESLNYQYTVSTNTWTENDWGGNANQIAEWNGSSWDFEVPAANDTVIVTDESLTYQYSGSVWSEFKFWIEVFNVGGVVETSTTAGSGLIGQRRQVATWNNLSGAITISSPFRSTPVVNDMIIVLPGTRVNVVDFFSNTKITSLPNKADIALADDGQKVQISSKLQGSDGFVQITGGRANDILQFSNTLVKGLRAYSYFTGLIKLVHSTIYGDEADLVTFPGVGAAGVKFQIKAPTVQEVAWSVNLRLSEGISLSSVENEVKTQIISYVDTLGVGAQVILANVVENVMGIEGIIDIQVTNPSANVDIAENELARTKASIISVNLVN